ncbi:general substrate transporter [Mollisia scopiformis]|uniref:General substrate transporter n=1 Tax=Mollisia scopiformis TaxID=149040 RepID=A0A132B3R9_MOLSC|nr:general substrate transporter [Mollisia scopiformis]KUJ06317.1 general substrate transporter [Mollisia scopiformis]
MAGLENRHSATCLDDHAPTGTSNITRDSWKDNKKGIAICFLINMAMFEFGLDQGMVSGFQAMSGFLHDFGYQDPHLPGGYGISTTVQQLITSLVSAGMFVSTFVSGWMSNKIGRKGGLWVAIFLMILSVTIQIAVIKPGALYAGRILLGFSNGLLLVCAQLYVQETIPSNLRSLAYTFYQFWISFGALLGTVINNETSKRLDRSSYRIPLAVLYILPVLLAIALLFLPETPRHLAAHGKYDEATQALRFLRDAAYTDLQIREEMAEIKHAIEIDEEIINTIGYRELFRTASIKRTLTSLAWYGVYFFMLSGDTQPFRDVVILSCVGLAGVLVTPLFTGQVGKRLILMTGGLVQGLCMLGMALSYSIRGIDGVSGRVIIPMSCLYLFTASSTTSPYSWQVAGEVPAQRLRGHTLGFASSVTYLCGWSITFTIPYFINPTALNWGAQYAYIWFASNLLICVFTFFVVPETNKRTLEEIDECYIQKIPIRNFPRYECVGTMSSRLEAVQKLESEHE